MTITLLENVTTDTVGQFKDSDGFQGALVIDGNADGGTITIEVSADGGATALPLLDQTGTPINAFTVVGFYSQFAIPKGLLSECPATSPVPSMISVITPPGVILKALWLRKPVT